MAPIIDLRSDTVTRPTKAMRQAMFDAPLGDDVLGDDPTVRQLEEKFAALLGKPAACFVPSGTMANQIAIRAHTEPGDEIITHEESHIVLYEGGGPAALSGCLVRMLCGPRGLFEPSAVAAAIRSHNDHFPVSKLLVAENTHNRGGGSVWPIQELEEVSHLARMRGLKLHLDGARLWNAHVASGVAMSRFGALFDTVACCFSKGLGAPVGSALAGDGETIRRARRFRKMFGGGMRQSGLLAAAALFAMDHHISRLAQDHQHARRLGAALASIPGLSLDPDQISHGVETNIVYIDISPSRQTPAATLCERLSQLGVLVLATGEHRVRAVTHLDVDPDAIEHAIKAFTKVMA